MPLRSSRLADTEIPRTGSLVLIVEDNPLIALDLEAILLDLGAVDVAIATSVSQALQLIAARPFDIALIDVKLGNVTSMPLAAALRDADIPFCFATGYDPKSIPSEFHSHPILLKPYQRAEVEVVVEQLARMAGKR